MKNLNRWFMSSLAFMAILLISFAMPALGSDSLPPPAGSIIQNYPQSTAFTGDPFSTGRGMLRMSFSTENISGTFSALVPSLGDTGTTFTVEAIYSDTLALTTSNAGANPTTDTERIIQTSDTAQFFFRITNEGNTTDTIGVIVDSAILDVAGAISGDSLGGWSYQFTTDTGAALTARLYTSGADTALVLLPSLGSRELILNVFADADTRVAGDSTILFFLKSYVGNDSPTQFAVRQYKGFDGDSYAGDGHDSIQLFVSITSVLIHLAKADTVFSPVALSADTQDVYHYVPGAKVVYTIWFDQDGTNSTDTLIIEDWIDTRFVQFSETGYTTDTTVGPGGSDTGVYGNIFMDSHHLPYDTGVDIKIEYLLAGVYTPLTTGVAPDAVSRIRWTIQRTVGGAGGVLGAHTSNGGQDGTGSADTAPVAFNSTSDTDMGFVRFSVVIR